MNNNVSQDKKDCIIPYTEPTLTNEVVYESDAVTLRKIWEWDIVGAYEDRETGLIKCLIRGEVFQNGISTCILPIGKRLSYLNFCWFYDYEDGMLQVSNGDGYGYVDTNFNLVYQLVYDWDAHDGFRNGFSTGVRNGEGFLLDKKGNEIAIKTNNDYVKATKVRRHGDLYIATIIDKEGQNREFIVDTDVKPRLGTLLKHQVRLLVPSLKCLWAAQAQ